MIDINDIINNNKKLITENYFEAQSFLEKIYGLNTVLLIQIGSFYEVYGTESKGKAREISKILNIALTKKNKSIEKTTERNPEMCGFPDVAIEKHLEKLILENNWNIAIINQVGTGSNVIRKLEKIVSPGTNTDFLSDEYNFIASIHIEKTKDGITYGGMSLIDLSIGKTLIAESYSNKDDLLYSVDNFKDILTKYKTTELIISYNGFHKNEIEKLFDLNIETHFKESSEIKKEENISYQNTLFKKIFKLSSLLSPIEELNLERNQNIASSLSVLISFIIEHNYLLSENLQLPQYLNDNKFLYLGNNPLSQLNIINEKHCLEKIINNGISAIGKRYIKEQLLNPLKDVNEINKRFRITSDLLKFKKEDVNTIEENLKKIYDLERIFRKIQIEKINPFEIYNLYNSFLSINKILKYLKLDLTKEKEIQLNKTILKIENSFLIDKLVYFNINNITSSFIKEGVSEELDNYVNTLKKETIALLEKASYIDFIIEENVYKFNDSNLKDGKKIFANINICFNETEGYYIELSKNKYDKKSSEINAFIGKDSFIKKLKGCVKLYINDISEISNKITNLEQKIIYLNKEIYKKTMLKISEEINIKEISLFIGQVDFYLNNYKLINKYGYKIPLICESEKSFIDIKNLRHPIVESFEQNGIFVANNVVLGHKDFHREYDEVIMQNEDEINGLMLYGLNSSGKTTLSKALGIAIIMGQAGFPIAGDGVFSIFESLFTRIKGDDDLENGLSTFAVEMLELKNILNRANNKSLVLGDEISHGTETISGLSIVSASVLELVEKDSLFLFATHLHQLRDIKEFNNEQKIKDVHLTVKYDEKKDLLIYDRKLKSGSGSSLYGLEFAKFLKLPTSFLNRAYSIRNELAVDLNEDECIIKNKTSKYNSKHLITTCSICGNKADDVHHIKEQQEADENDLIDGVHKNHKHNLVNLCKKHHQDVHSGKLIINGYIKTSQGFVLDYQNL